MPCLNRFKLWRHFADQIADTGWYQTENVTSKMKLGRTDSHDKIFPDTRSYGAVRISPSAPINTVTGYLRKELLWLRQLFTIIYRLSLAWFCHPALRPRWQAHTEPANSPNARTMRTTASPRCLPPPLLMKCWIWIPPHSATVKDISPSAKLVSSRVRFFVI